MKTILFFALIICLVGHRSVFAADKHIPKAHHKIYKKAIVVIGKTALPKEEDDKLGRPAGMP